MILTLIEHDGQSVADSSLQALALARAIDRPEAVSIGRCPASVVSTLGDHGAARVHVVEHDLAGDYGPDVWAESIAQLADSTGAAAVLAAGTDRGNEVMAHVAARRDVPFAANVLAVDAGDGWEVTRLRWGGSLHEVASLDAPLKVATVAPHAIPAEAAGGAEPEVTSFTPLLGDEGTTSVVDRVTIEEGVTLATAPVVVSGGRGVGSAEAFALLEDLAGLLDGVVGCSRVATNNGWRPHADQVGQTGTRVAPDLYVACGISGATQHWVGMMASKTILAINVDPEAPMVVKADYALIGDLHDLVPEIAREIRRRRGT